METYYVDLTRSCLHAAAGKLETAQSYAMQADLPHFWPGTTQERLARILRSVRKLSDELHGVGLMGDTGGEHD